MWVRRPESCVYCIVIMIFQLLDVESHIASHVSTPSNRVEQYCELAESCVHDTIPVCGKLNEEKRSFLDLCDLMEYACDTDNIFTHIDDEVGCPVERARPGEE